MCPLAAESQVSKKWESSTLAQSSRSYLASAGYERLETTYDNVIDPNSLPAEGA